MSNTYGMKQRILFIYINDLSSSVNHSKTFLFADDTKCLRPICSPHDCILLQSDIDILSLWSTNWKLKFNEMKCSRLSIVSHASSNHSDTQVEYLINGLPISSCNQQKKPQNTTNTIIRSILHGLTILSKTTSNTYTILILRSVAH